MASLPDSITGERLWTMLAHYHGNLINYAEIGRSLELNIHTIKRYIGFLKSAFLIRIIEPFHLNAKKRLVKSPKVYIRDSGVMHIYQALKILISFRVIQKKGPPGKAL